MDGGSVVGVFGLSGRVEDDLSGLGVDGLGVVSADEAARQLDGEAGGGLGVELGEAVLDEQRDGASDAESVCG